MYCRHNDKNETIPFATMMVRVARIVAGGGISVFHNQEKSCSVILFFSLDILLDGIVLHGT